MTIPLKILLGLVAGYTVGIVLAAIVAFALDLEEVARFVAIGCGLLGAALGPMVFGRASKYP